MGGGLIQLTSLGKQDNYLVSNPQYSYFKSVYRRHTNFSIESVQQTFNRPASVESTTLTSKLTQNGDLIYHVWLEVELKNGGYQNEKTGQTDPNHYSGWTNNTGYALIKEYELLIGGKRIDIHYSQWMDIYNELNDHDDSEWIGVNKHASKELYLTTSFNLPNLKLYIPLKFWFCRKSSLALPIIALQYHDVEIKILTRNLNCLINTNRIKETTSGITEPPDFNIWVDYIYLDNDERKRFAQKPHEYLIEQVQMEEKSAKLLETINFNFPVKELIWVFQNNRVKQEKEFKSGLRETQPGEEKEADTGFNAVKNSDGIVSQSNDYFNYQSGYRKKDEENDIDESGNINIEEFYGIEQYESFGTFTLLINGNERFSPRNASYFRLCQPIQAGHNLPKKHIYLYSFALKPEEHQPSGTCNFSRMNDIKMLFTGKVNEDNETTLTVYAVNYNILRIKSGMAALLFAGNTKVVKKKVQTQKRNVRGRRNR